jgi:polyisoprenoid-binding protein YceI
MNFLGQYLFNKTTMPNKIKWSIDQALSKIIFKVNGVIFSSVEGRFKTFGAEILTTGKNFETAEISLWIDGSTITTGDNKRDEHLKSADFFDTENHKLITFKSLKIGSANVNGSHELTGELTIKDITKTVTLNVEFSDILHDRWGNENAGFNIKGKINRKEWGLTWNAAVETGGLIVSEDATLSCEIQLINSVQGLSLPELNL